MADPYQHLSKGDAPRIIAESWNAALDAGREFRRTMLGKQGGQAPDSPITPSLIILVRNDTGADKPARSVLALGDPVGDPVNLPIAFRNRPVFAGTLPAAATDAFAILLDGAADGAIGRACLMGETVADVHVNDAAHQYAVPVAGVSSYLDSAAIGPVRIEWKETSGVSTKRSIVFITQAGGIAGVTVRDDKANSFTPITDIEVRNATFTQTRGAGTADLTIDPSFVRISVSDDKDHAAITRDHRVANSTVATVSTTLNGAIVSGATSLVVASSSGFPATPFPILIDWEILNVTHISGTTWTVSRGQDGTTAAAHADTSAVGWTLTTIDVASTTQNGLMDTATQSFLGIKNFFNSLSPPYGQGTKIDGPTVTVGPTATGSTVVTGDGVSGGNLGNQGTIVWGTPGHPGGLPAAGGVSIIDGFGGCIGLNPTSEQVELQLLYPNASSGSTSNDELIQQFQEYPVSYDSTYHPILNFRLYDGYDGGYRLHASLQLANGTLCLGKDFTTIASAADMFNEDPITGAPNFALRYAIFDGSTFYGGDGGTDPVGNVFKGGICTTVSTTPISITIGTTPISGGTNGRILFEGGGNAQQSADLSFDDSAKNLTLGSGGFLTTTGSSAPSGIPTNSIAGPFISN